MCTIGIDPHFQNEAMLSIASNALVGFVSAALCTSILPIAGAIFGTFAGFTFTIIDLHLASSFDNSAWGKAARVAIALLSSIVIGTAATVALDFSLTLEGALFLTLMMSITTVAVNQLYRCCCFSRPQIYNTQ
jgi:hypothetical protein